MSFYYDNQTRSQAESLIEKQRLGDESAMDEVAEVEE
jgi:hypothetical protein